MHRFQADSLLHYDKTLNLCYYRGELFTPFNHDESLLIISDFLKFLVQIQLVQYQCQEHNDLFIQKYKNVLYLSAYICFNVDER